MTVHSLSKAFDRYTSEVERYLSAKRGIVPADVLPPNIAPLPSAVRSWFDECERFESWRDFVQAWGAVLEENGWAIKQNQDTFRLDATALASWCRRRGLYLALLKGQRAVITEKIQALLTDSRIHGKNDAVTYIALLRTVDYSWEEQIRDEKELLHWNDVFFPPGLLDFEDFQIGNVAAQDLRQRLGIVNQRVFYPAESISIPDGAYHCYCLIRSAGARIGHRDISHYKPVYLLGGKSPVGTYGDVAEEPLGPEHLVDAEPWVLLPSVVERVYKVLLLWKWQCFGDFHSRGSYEARLMITAILRLCENPFFPPRRSLMMGKEMVPEDCFPYDTFDKPHDASRFIQNPEGVGEEFGNYVLYSRDTAAIFATFVQDQIRRLREIDNIAQWRFVDLALSFFCKSLVADNNAERLLWCMASLEAMLGKKDQSTATGRRLEALCGYHVALPDKKPKATTRVKSLFEKLYEIRCRLVHGDVIIHDLRSRQRAHVLTRFAIVRMVYLLGELIAELKAGTIPRLPSREEIRDAIDAISNKTELTFLPLARTIQRILVDCKYSW
jgi:hypothetical protein